MNPHNNHANSQSQGSRRRRRQPLQRQPILGDAEERLLPDGMVSHDYYALQQQQQQLQYQQQHQLQHQLQQQHQQQHYQQQYQQQYPMQQHYGPQQSFAQPVDYHQQLEQELELQQQQFQQQFLQQYRLVQEQQMQYEGMGQPEWMHEGFTGHDLGANPYSFGFQSTTHNLNLAAHYTDVSPTIAGATSQFPPPPPPLQSDGSEGASRRRTGRPWVAGGSQASQQHSHLKDNTADTAVPSRDSPSAANTDELSESDESFSSNSSVANSSDESIYKLTTNIATHKRSVLEATSQSKPTSTVASIKQARPHTLKSGLAHASPHTASIATPCVLDPRNASTGETSINEANAEAGSSDDDDDDDDDDIPLSIISVSTTPSYDVSIAAVRRTKSTAPSALHSQQRIRDLKDTGVDAIIRGASKSRSLLVHPKAASRKGRHQHTPSHSVENDIVPKRPELLVSESEDDEDAPLDKLKAELVSGTRPVPDIGSGAATQESNKRTAGMGNSSVNKGDVADTDDRGDSPNLDTVFAAGTGTGTDTDASAHASASASIESIAQDSNIMPAGKSLHSSISSFQQNQGPLPGPTEDAVPVDVEIEDAHPHRRTDESGASVPISKATSPELLAKELSSEDRADDQAGSKPRRTAKYLPSGTALPALPVAQRSIRPRVAVQYIALADIAESTERALNNVTGASQGFDDIDPMQTDMENGDQLQRQKSMKASGGPGEGDGTAAEDSGSMKSHFTIDSSSGDTMLDVLRNGPVDLLTASTEHSGSKAVIDWVVPEDYGDIDRLLTDLDGIMSGSLAARRRFSFALMRRSLAVSNGLVEPADFSEHSDDLNETEAQSEHHMAIEFKPLEISNIETDLSAVETGGGGGGLGLDDAFMSTLNFESTDDTAIDEDSQPLTEIATRAAAAAAKLGGLDTQLELEPLEMPPLKPVELTRSEKVQKALEKLQILDVRKVSIRIFVQNAQRYYTFSLTKYTTCEMILNDMKKSNMIDPHKSTWALFELVEHFGIERPLNHFENLMSVVEGWEPRSNNFIIAKGFELQSALTLLGGVQPGDHAIQGMLYYQVKKGKWQKGVFRLQGHNMIYVKDGRGRTKKETHYLSLTNSDVYTPFAPLKGTPTKYVFGLKSEMPMQMFERPDEDYVKWFAVPTLDNLREWLRVFRLAKNQIKFRQLLENRVVEAGAIRGADGTLPVNKPLVDLSADKRDEAGEAAGAKNNSDFASELVNSINRISASGRYDPSALVRAVEQGGVDVSDFIALAPGSKAQGGDENDDELNSEDIFLPGTLLSRPRKTALEAKANQQLEPELFAKGSLLSQPRESKALAASRAMQSILAQDGNVFTQGSLLQVTEQTKPRPPHVGGAANQPHGQFPLVQFDMSPPDLGKFSAAKPPPYAMAARSGMPLVSYENEPIFGGLMANAYDQHTKHL
ncbi:hypothetical protein GGI07_003749 [Coemansia sp. Benny D115]|nr:hypothetical protein GGI07_003749 [Coemansia sp. Benny D115]